MRTPRPRGLRMLAATLLTLCASLAQAGPGLQAMLESRIPASEAVRAVAMFDAPPSAAQVTALQALGLQAQGLKHLPMALTKGLSLIHI